MDIERITITSLNQNCTKTAGGIFSLYYNSNPVIKQNSSKVITFINNNNNKLPVAQVNIGKVKF